MKNLLRLRLVCLLFVSSATLVSGQTVSAFQQHFSGKTHFHKGKLTITESGYLSFPDRAHGYFIWNVPSDVKEIIIEKEVLVNAAFHFTHGLSIRGKDRATSIIYGTEIEAWDDNNGLSPLQRVWQYSAIWAREGAGISSVRNLTILNPKGYAIRAYESEQRLNVYNCNFIDKRGGVHNHSDGVTTGPGSIIRNCYFESGDDNIKVYRPRLKVRNCTFRMRPNSVPFQLGWGRYTNGASADIRNVYITGEHGRLGKGNNYIIGGGTWYKPQGNSNVTLNIRGIYADNPNATLVNVRSKGQSLNGRITNANLHIAATFGEMGHGDDTPEQYGLPENIQLSCCGQRLSSDTLPDCSSRKYSGSSVDHYNVPAFAKKYIRTNTGNNSKGKVPTIQEVNNFMKK